MAEPVVLVHSSGMSSRQWKALIPALSGYSVAAPDLIGYGRSERWLGPGPFDLADDVAVVARAARELGEPVHLIGHSYGGLLCLFAAARRAVRVRSLALYEPIPFGILRERNDAEAVADLNRVGDTLLDPAMEGTEAWLRGFVDYWNGPGSWDAMPEQARARFGAAAIKTFHEVRSLTFDRTPLADYAAIEAPTLILRGSETTVAERRTCAILAGAMPNARLEVIEGAGHMGPITHPTAVADAMLRHLGQVGGGGGSAD